MSLWWRIYTSKCVRHHENIRVITNLLIFALETTEKSIERYKRKEQLFKSVGAVRYANDLGAWPSLCGNSYYNAWAIEVISRTIVYINFLIGCLSMGLICRAPSVNALFHFRVKNRCTVYLLARHCIFLYTYFRLEFA